MHEYLEQHVIRNTKASLQVNVNKLLLLNLRAMQEAREKKFTVRTYVKYNKNKINRENTKHIYPTHVFCLNTAGVTHVKGRRSTAREFLQNG